jgi:hypothetical protein
MDKMFQELSAEAKFNILQTELSSFEPIASTSRIQHPLLQPLPTFNDSFPKFSNPQLKNQPPGFTPSSSSLMWSEIHTKDYSVTKVNTQGVPFIYIVTPDFHHLQPEEYKNEKVKIATPTSTTVAEVVAKIETKAPTKPVRRRQRQEEKHEEMEMSVLSGQLDKEDIEFAINGF